MIDTTENIMSGIIKFSYNSNDISFDKSNGVMVNATEMAKPFGKTINHWCENLATTEFIVELAKARGIEYNTQYAKLLNSSDNGKAVSLTISELANLYPTLISVVKGGLEQQGTWLHEDLAIEFARWLSPKFAIWCNDRIKELLTQGITATDNVIEQILDNPDMGIALLTKLKEERAKRKEAETTVAILTHTNKTYTATEIAKELGFRSAIELNKALAQKGVQYKQNDTWIPYADYAQKGWFEIKQEVLDNGHIIYHRRVTGLGRKALIGMFNK